jgi:hypothetical protein
MRQHVSSKHREAWDGRRQVSLAMSVVASLVKHLQGDQMLSFGQTSKSRSTELITTTTQVQLEPKEGKRFWFSAQTLTI